MRAISPHIHPFFNVLVMLRFSFCRLVSSFRWMTVDLDVRCHQFTGNSPQLNQRGGRPEQSMHILKRRRKKLVTAVLVCWILIPSEISGTESSPFKGDAGFTHEHSHHLSRLRQVSQFPLSPVQRTHVGESCEGGWGGGLPVDFLSWILRFVLTRSSSPRCGKLSYFKSFLLFFFYLSLHFYYYWSTC